MRYLNIISVVLLLIICSCSPSSYNRDFRDKLSDLERDVFFADPIVFYETDSLHPRLDLNIEIPIENISFQKDYSNQKYYSKVTISVYIKNSAKETILSKSYDVPSSYGSDEIKQKAKESQFYFYNYHVEPGKYKLEVNVNDVYSNNEYRKSFDISVKDFNSADISFSDLMMLSKVEINQDGTKYITPLVSNNLFGLKELYAFFEIYNKTNTDISKEYIFKLKNNKGSIVKEYTLSYVLSPGKNQEFESMFILKEMKNFIPIEQDYDYPEMNDVQKLFFILELLDKSGNELVARKKLYFFPDRLIPQMMNRPPPQRSESK